MRHATLAVALLLPLAGTAVHAADRPGRRRPAVAQGPGREAGRAQRQVQGGEGPGDRSHERRRSDAWSARRSR